jgi:hypothetical protein
MITINTMARPRNMLELRLHEPATPARVERAAKMFDASLKALGLAGDTTITLVVENKSLKATLRTRSPAGADRVRMLVEMVERPLGVDAGASWKAPVATALAQYARDEARYRPEFWVPGRKKPVCSLDSEFAGVMEAIAASAANAPGTDRVRGSTYVYSKILRIGRQDERQAHRARIMLEGRAIDLALAPDLEVAPFFDVAKREEVVRVRLRAEWIHRPDSAPELDTATITGIDLGSSPASGARILALAAQHRVITSDDLPAVLSSIDRPLVDD